MSLPFPYAKYGHQGTESFPDEKMMALHYWAETNTNGLVNLSFQTRPNIKIVGETLLSCPLLSLYQGHLEHFFLYFPNMCWKKRYHETMIYWRRVNQTEFGFPLPSFSSYDVHNYIKLSLSFCHSRSF